MRLGALDSHHFTLNKIERAGSVLTPTVEVFLNPSELHLSLHELRCMIAAAKQLDLQYFYNSPIDLPTRTRTVDFT